MVKKNKGVIKLSKKDLRKALQLGITLVLVLIISYWLYVFIQNYKAEQWTKVFAERDEYCNTTWKDYINAEVINQTTESIYVTKKCFYENQYVMDKLSSLCLCTFEVYDLNGTLINDNFTLLYSVFNNV